MATKNKIEIATKKGNIELTKGAIILVLLFSVIIGALLGSLVADLVP